MIARIWRGRVPVETADRYLAYLERTEVRDLLRCPGSIGVRVLQRRVGDSNEVLCLSLWESREALEHAAGSKPQVTWAYPHDARFGAEKEPEGRLIEVAGDG